MSPSFIWQCIEKIVNSMLETQTNTTYFFELVLKTTNLKKE